eukprot:11217-Chlamydomonas_euryale.AAC.5
MFYLLHDDEEVVVTRQAVVRRRRRVVDALLEQLAVEVVHGLRHATGQRRPQRPRRSAGPRRPDRACHLAWVDHERVAAARGALPRLPHAHAQDGGIEGEARERDVRDRREEEQEVDLVDEMLREERPLRRTARVNALVIVGERSGNADRRQRRLDCDEQDGDDAQSKDFGLGGGGRAMAIRAQGGRAW